MNKIIIIILSILIGYTELQAQYYEIVYDEIKNSTGRLRNSTYNLLIDGKKSVYYQLDTKLQNNTEERVIEKDKHIIPIYKKDFLSKKLIFQGSPLDDNKSIWIIQESLPLQQWEIGAETREIGKFLCKKATCFFRGREYIAWYTEEIPLLGGPWKFDGLPGLILEVASIDDFFSIKVRTLVLKQGEMRETPIDIKSSTVMSWEEYCDQYKQWMKRVEKRWLASAEPGDEFKLSFNAIEDMGVQEILLKK